MANENKEKKTGRFGQFFKEVSGEVKKLSWPTKKEIVSYTLTVIAFILLMAVVIYALDLVFGEGLGQFKERVCPRKQSGMLRIPIQATRRR